MIIGLGCFVGGAARPQDDLWHLRADNGTSVSEVHDAVTALAQWSAAAAPRDFGVLLLEGGTPVERALVQEAFRLDALQMEDVANLRQRAKVEITDHHVLCILKSLAWDDGLRELSVSQISVITGPGIAIVFHDGGPVNVATAIGRLATHSALAEQGPGAAIYAVMDAVVDNYVVITDQLQTAVEDVETEVFAPAMKGATARIYQLNRQSLEFRRAVHPLVPLAHDLSQRSLNAVPAGLRSQFADVGDHILRVADAVDGYNTILLSMLMATTSLQDLQQNRDMRKISAWVAIAAVPTAIAAIYGMNFDFMPELHQPWGYPLVLAIMAGGCALLWRAFKRSGWL